MAGDVDAFAVTHQQIILRINADSFGPPDSSDANVAQEGQPIDATTTLTCQIEQKGTALEALCLHARYLNIARVRVALTGERLEFFDCTWECRSWSREEPEPQPLLSFGARLAEWTEKSWRARELSIKLPPGLFPAGGSDGIARTFELSIDYQILPRLQDMAEGGRNPSLLLGRQGPSSVLLAVLPVGELRLARYWVPCIDDVDALIEWDVRVQLADMEDVLVFGSGHLELGSGHSSHGLPSDHFANGVTDSNMDGIEHTGNARSNGSDSAGPYRLQDTHVHFSTRKLMPAGALGYGMWSGPVGTSPTVASAPTRTHVLCPPNKAGRLGPIADFVSRALPFHNWCLTQGGNGVAIDYPFPTLHLVFCRQLPAPMVAVAGVVLAAMELLPDPAVIDQTWETRRRICEALAWQYWWPAAADRASAWLAVGVRELAARLQLRAFHGHNDFRFQLRRDLQRITAIELAVVEDRGRVDGLGFALHDLHRPELERVAPQQHCRLKAVLVLALLEQRIGRAHFQRLLTQLYLELQAYVSLPDHSSQSGDAAGQGHSAAAHGDVGIQADHGNALHPGADEAHVPGNVLRQTQANAPNNPLNTAGFFRTAKRLTGKDLRSFVELWVYGSEALPRYRVSYTVQRARSIVQVGVEEQWGRHFHGSVLIRTHEAGAASYDHVVHIDEPLHRFDLPVHWRVRRTRVPKAKAERTVMDSINPPAGGDLELKAKSRSSDAAADALQSDASPASEGGIRWLRVDPDCEWLALWSVQQSDGQWADMLEHDRDVAAQLDAVAALHAHFTVLGDSALAAIERVVQDPKVFFHIRCLAALSLCNSVDLDWGISGGDRGLSRDDDGDWGGGYRVSLGDVTRGTPMTHVRKLLEMYARRHAHRDLATSEVMPRANAFNALPAYFVQCALVRAIGSVRDASGSGRPLDAIVRFLADFLRLNDNTGNACSDDHYLAGLLECLALALPPGPPSSTPLIEEAQAQVERYARRDRILPSHRNVVMQAVVRAYARFQASHDFYTNPAHHWEVRLQCFLRLLGEAASHGGQSAGSPTAGSANHPNESGAAPSGAPLAGNSTSNVSPNVPLLLQDNWQLHYGCVQATRRRLADGNLWAEALVLLRDYRMLWSAGSHGVEAPIAGAASLADAGGEDWLGGMSPGTASVAPAASEPGSVSGIASAASTLSSAGGLKLRLALKSSARAGEWAQLARNALDALWATPDAYPFRYPVDPTMPNYYRVIRTPMDLSTIRARIDADHYSDRLEPLLADLRLIVDNCATFNLPGSPIVRQSQRLARLAIQELRARFPGHAKLVRQSLRAHNVPAAAISVLPPESNMFDGTNADIQEAPAEDQAWGHASRADGDGTDGSPENDRLAKELTEKQMSYLLRKLIDHPDSFWFREPVDPVAFNLPTYLDVVREPMDLGSIRKRLGEHALPAAEFVRLVLLVFDNCLAFNAPDTLVYVHGHQLRDLFVAWLRDDRLLALAEGLSPSLGLVPASMAGIAPKVTEDPKRPALGLSVTDRLRRCINDLMEHPNSEPFNAPVDYRRLRLPHYLRVVKRPMDFGTIRCRLAPGSRRPYVRVGDFTKDVQQVFDNCLAFNGTVAEISRWALAVRAHLDAHWLPELSRLEHNDTRGDRGFGRPDVSH